MTASHHEIDSPSDWVRRWARLIPTHGRVLDVACGRGRHLRYLRALGLSTVGVDRDSAALEGLSGIAGIELCVADIEAVMWPFPPESFDAVVVTNYLHRPLFPALVGALRPGGVLIYETFAAGNERYGRPSNPEFLLCPGELLARVEPLSVVAFEQGLISLPKPALVQRICAVRGEEGSALLVSG